MQGPLTELLHFHPHPRITLQAVTSCCIDFEMVESKHPPSSSEGDGGSIV